jgi:putative flippase GtrA
MRAWATREGGGYPWDTRMGIDDTVSARAVSPPPQRGRLARSRTVGRAAGGIRHPVTGQLVRFAIVGVLNTAISLAVYKLAVDVGVAYPAASVLAFAVGALNSYTLNRIWTFRAGAFSRGGFARYVVVQLVGLGINELVLVAAVEGLSVDALAAQAVALVVASSVMFILNRQWAFAQRPASR